MVDGEIGKVYHPSYPLNNALPNSICSNYGKYDTYIVLNEFNKNGGLKEGFSTTRDDGGKYKFPAPIYIDGFENSQSSVNLTMSLDSQYIFIAMAEGGKKSNTDIFLSKKVDSGLYSHPTFLADINTEYRELTPFISHDQKTLYFASDRPGSIGGVDIYYAERLDESYEKWSLPTRYNPPLNTEADESYPFVLKDSNTLYFSSNREGSSDIFKINLYREESLLAPIKVNVTVLTADGSPIPAEIFWKEAYTKDAPEEYFRSRDGKYTITLTNSEPILFYAQNRSRHSQKELIDPLDYEKQNKQNIDLTLILSPKGEIKNVITSQSSPDIDPREKDDVFPFKVNKDKIILLENIYFEKSKPNVLSVSFDELRKLAEILKKKSLLKIRIEGHTDNVGNKNSLLELSKLRAEEIKKFLISEGVDESRISTMGFGDTKPLTSNLNEAEKQKNRRVEIRLLNE
jgi:outer membrane protein OmpA-like peptidoglycan-associated protein